METYGKILVIAMPVFLLLVFFEKWYGYKKGNDTVRYMDMVSSLTSGVTNVTKDVLGLAFAIISYGWLAQRIAITHVAATWLTYLVAFIALDLAGYLVHALSHKVNFFWNGHIIHHSSEDFNLACALRQSVSVFVKLFVILLIPAALLGVPAKVIAIVAPLHLFAQFWYHTQHIKKMGFLEKIIVTPSHHRVHHAINKEYMDKNYGQILIIWDRLFGSFQPELENVPAVYGVSRPVQTWNPIKINFLHMKLLLQDAWRTKNWNEKLKVFYGPTGWRPADVTEKYPVYKIEDVYNFERYEKPGYKGFQAYVLFQLLALLLFVSYLFSNIALIGKPDIFIYGAFIFIFVYALTDLMDGNKYAFVWEGLKMIMGVSIILVGGDWFKIASFFPPASWLFIVYFILSFIVTFSFSRKLSSASVQNVQTSFS